MINFVHPSHEHARPIATRVIKSISVHWSLMTQVLGSQFCKNKSLQEQEQTRQLNKNKETPVRDMSSTVEHAKCQAFSYYKI
jgi:hypothetical protein